MKNCGVAYGDRFKICPQSGLLNYSLKRKAVSTVNLFDIVYEDERSGLTDCVIGKVTDDNRLVEKGDVFVAIAGRNFDGHDFCADMLEKGASAVVTERDLGLSQQIIVKNSREYFSILASRYYGNPTKKLKLIAATGTNGKTTTSNLIKEIMNLSGHTCGYIGTSGYDVCGKVYEARLTTPRQMDLYRYFREMVDNGAEYCVMEASSQALSQYRFAGERFVCGIFLNLTQDHLDWHGTMENYYKAKKSLFRFCDNAVINTDDKYGKRLYDELSRGKDKINLVSVSSSDVADFFAVNIKLRAGGVSYWLSSSADEKSFPVTFSMPGRFNVENSLCAVAACCQSGFDIKTACDNLQQVKGVCGRAEVLYDGKFTVICDYAHTEDGLRKILSTVREFAKKRLIVVFGAAGERDAGKRKAMGECVGEYADIAVVTSDNPRFEDPQTIIDMVLEGFSDSFCQVESFIDRLEAIKFAVSAAADGDVIVLCGKGHEKYQVIGDDYQPFSEHDIIKELTDNIS